MCLRSRDPCWDIPYEFRIKTIFGSLLPPCLICVICVCLRIVVSNTYCVVFLFSSSCVHYGLSILIAPSVFFSSNNKTLNARLLARVITGYAITRNGAAAEIFCARLQSF
jgi:hypothetical protein